VYLNEREFASGPVEPEPSGAEARRLRVRLNRLAALPEPSAPPQATVVLDWPVSTQK
jgi:hypothetical protein